MFKLQKKTIRTIVSVIKEQEKGFQTQLFNNYSSNLTPKDQDYEWEKFIELILNENDYNDFVNDILNNIPIQDRNCAQEKIQNALAENGYDFKIFDELWRICIKGSKCLLYLTKEEDGVFVNKRLCQFQPLDKEIFEREKVILSNLQLRGLHISPKTFHSTDRNVIKIEKCEISLYDYINNGQVLEIDKLIDILLKVSQLHRIGFLHRDLHPDNIMLLNKDWFLIDFNVAHCPMSSNAVSLMQNVGWKEYTDPVVYQEGLHVASIKTDIYSIGKLVNFIITHDPNNSNHFLSDVVNRCIRDNHNERYDSVYEIIRDINLKNLK